MASNRDNFTKKTIEILAKRVAFHCSNPDCQKITVGPNDDAEKTTIVGVAAHITAASPNGPRFNPNLTEEERRHISNGIWLCSNCATLIDKDPDKYPIELLNEWRKQMESNISHQLLTDKTNAILAPGRPFLEADITWNYGSRRNRGYSPRNKPHIILGEDIPIIYWDISWNYSITLYNNSKFDAYNVQINTVGDIGFQELTKINKINNLPALENMEVSAKFHDFIEGTYLEADALLNKQIPDRLNGLQLEITYLDESRGHQLTTFAEIIGSEIVNKRLP